MQWRRKLNVTARGARKILDHAHFAYSMLLGKSLLVVAMKKRTVSQAEYALQLLIHEISHDGLMPNLYV